LTLLWASFNNVLLYSVVHHPLSPYKRDGLSAPSEACPSKESARQMSDLKIAERRAVHDEEESQRLRGLFSSACGESIEDSLVG
jgi:hypothetical protein